jgi:hypothetical protein
VLIGGTASTLAMEDTGLAFRATKDHDVAVHIEALDATFGKTFWHFIDQLLAPEPRIQATGKIVAERRRFLDEILAEGDINPGALGLKGTPGLRPPNHDR